jgi:cell filamentation protein, protein adenylyltransferase
VTFDPFGDFETQGYLRNLTKEKDPEIVRHLEHTSFMTGIDAALERIAKIKQLSYPDLLETHRILFEAVYPWAGQDRRTTAPDLAISRGPVLFAHPDEIQLAADYALTHGQDKEFMKTKPGEIMGYLAYAHPFLDGNGRTIMLVHALLAQRAGFSIDWAATGKADYLSALTKELDDPGKGLLDAYLGPFRRDAVPKDGLAEKIVQAPGLDGTDEQNEVLGKTSDPALKARYEQQKLKRKAGT